MPPETPSGYAFQKQGSELPLPLTGTETFLRVVLILPCLGPNYLYPSRGRKLIVQCCRHDQQFGSELPLPLTGTETPSSNRHVLLIIKWSELPLPLTGTETRFIIPPHLASKSPNYLYPSRGRKLLKQLTNQ